MDTVNVILSGALLLCLLFAILSPRVHDNLAMRVGLVLISLGLAGVVIREFDGIDSWIGTRDSLRLIFIGGLAVFFGIAIRCRWFRSEKWKSSHSQSA